MLIWFAKKKEKYVLIKKFIDESLITINYIYMYSFFQLVSAFTNQSVNFQATKGGKFQLFDGNITGEFLELVSIYEVKS